MKNWILIFTSLCLFGQIALAEEKRQPKSYTIPTIDLSKQTKRQVVIDREKGQYLGHPTTVLGVVRQEPHLTVVDGDDTLISMDVESMALAWKGTLDLTGGMA